ncbi:unnamed protein product [Pleuronectes platessa]|uniref:Uncharacterized protein n=1 Tax=Pleuronectes platessa TaxID=8262 RepID=A0A9N7YVK9_PLEPL|nr:unnamed protein product [Pleuronectes platessa]
MKIDPPVADCSDSSNLEKPVIVNVNATIQNSNESYNVFWQFPGAGLNKGSKPASEGTLVFSFKSEFSCRKMNETKWEVSFKNQKGQTKNESVNILVISASEKYCTENDNWPKTPGGVLSQLLGASRGPLPEGGPPRERRVPSAGAVAGVIQEKGPTRVQSRRRRTPYPVPSNRSPPPEPPTDTAPRSKRKKAPASTTP